MTAVLDRDEYRRLVDELLAPDPGVDVLPGDRWYRSVTDERALEAARRRHERDLRDRYRMSVEWADFSVQDLRLPMTVRQTHAVTAALLVCVVAAVVGAAVGSVPVLAVAVAGSAALAVVVVRDVYRRVMLWLLER